MPDKGLSAGIANDDSAWLGDDGATAFLNLAALVAEVVQPPRPLRGRVRRQRRQILGGLRRWRQRCGDRRRRTAHGQRRGTRGCGTLISRTSCRRRGGRCVRARRCGTACRRRGTGCPRRGTRRRSGGGRRGRRGRRSQLRLRRRRTRRRRLLRCRGRWRRCRGRRRGWPRGRRCGRRRRWNGPCRRCCGGWRCGWRRRRNGPCRRRGGRRRGCRARRSARGWWGRALWGRWRWRTLGRRLPGRLLCGLLGCLLCRMLGLSLFRRRRLRGGLRLRCGACKLHGRQRGRGKQQESKSGHVILVLRDGQWSDPDTRLPLRQAHRKCQDQSPTRSEGAAINKYALGRIVARRESEARYISERQAAERNLFMAHSAGRFKAFSYIVPCECGTALVPPEPFSRGSVADRFDVVTVRIEHEGAVVVGVVMGADAWRAVIAAAGLDR